jgi:hypothetical protein
LGETITPDELGLLILVDFQVHLKLILMRFLLLSLITIAIAASDNSTSDILATEIQTLEELISLQKQKLEYLRMLRNTLLSSNASIPVVTVSGLNAFRKWTQHFFPVLLEAEFQCRGLLQRNKPASRKASR